MVSKRIQRCLVAALLAIHAVLLAWAAVVDSPTLDEIGHFSAGLNHWKLGRFDMYRVNPHLVRTVAAIPPVLMGAEPDWSRLLKDGYSRQLEFPIGDKFAADTGPRFCRFITVARWACIVFSVTGGFCCYLSAHELFGILAGLLALTLWCFGPNTLGHAHLITPDAGAAALGCVAGYTFWRWLRVGGWSRTILAGVTLGLAELTKTTWIILFPLWPLLWLLWCWNKPAPPEGGRRCRGSRELLLILGLGWLLINVGYGYEGSFEPLGNFDFVSDTLRGPAPPYPRSTNRFVGSWLENVPVPFPRNYILGIDEQRHDFERGIMSYLRGEWRHGGWWYYYLYGLLVKVPLGTWALFLIAVAARLLKKGASGWCDDVVLLCPGIVVLVLVSSQTGFNQHLRYVLPALPFLLVWISRVASPRVLASLLCRCVVWCLAFWSVGSSLAVYPHSLSYFNEAAGGPQNGHAHLVDSNIDWGQDLLFLKQWLDAHPEARPLQLAYFGRMDPRVIGIDFAPPPKALPPGGTGDVNHGAVHGPLPGWHAVSVTLLRGYKYTFPNGRGGLEYLDQPYYAYFRELEPAARAGYSIYIYHVSLEDANRLRRKLGLRPVRGPVAGP